MPDKLGVSIVKYLCPICGKEADIRNYSENILFFSDFTCSLWHFLISI